MLVTHWVKFSIIVVHLTATAWVLSQCQRLSAPPQTKSGSATPQTQVQHAPGKEDPANPLSEAAQRRAEQRRRHAAEQAERRARHGHATGSFVPKFLPVLA